VAYFKLIHLKILSESTLVPKSIAAFLQEYSTLKMEAAESSESLVLFSQTTRRHISEERNPDTHRRKSLRCYIVGLFVGY
jgi:hypothetical protein